MGNQKSKYPIDGSMKQYFSTQTQNCQLFIAGDESNLSFHSFVCNNM